MNTNNRVPRGSLTLWATLPLALIATNAAQSAPQAKPEVKEQAPVTQLRVTQAQVTVDSDGTIHLPAMAIPFSSLLSPQAKKSFLDSVVHPYPEPSGSLADPAVISRYRQDFDREVFQPSLQKNLAHYPVSIEPRTIAGVYTDVITPKAGVSAKNAKRVLINLHGGGMLIGGRLGGQLESLPIASTGKIKVIAVDYRMWPEHKFPAASEDVAMVYRQLLKEYEPENIGIFGCSAGGALAGQAVAWFQKEKLPAPGAIAMLCIGGVNLSEGDSGFLWSPGPRPTPGGPRLEIGYFAGISLDDPLAYPASSQTVLGQFPPTLILTGTRSFDLSPAVHTDIQLTKAGAISELHVWDGLGHCEFLSDPDMPEVEDASGFIVNFFDRHLGKSRQK